MDEEGEKTRRRRKGHAKDRIKELYREQNEGGIRIESRNRCLREEAKGLH